MSEKKLHIGIIGAGRIGRVHAETLAFRLPEAQIVAITDVNREAALTLAARCGIPKVADSSAAILADPGIDAVLICSSTNTHADLIVEAAKAGKHIFCEKPIAHSLGQIDRALAAVKAAGVQLQIGFNRRFDANFARVRQAVVSGEIGKPSLMHIISRDPGPPPISYIRVSGGMFMDMTIHDFDMVRFLSGSEAIEVFAVGNALVDPEIGRAGDVDTCIVTLRLENGALATIDNSRQAVYGYDQRVEVFGSAGMVAVSNRTPDNHVLLSANDASSAKPQYFFLERYQEAYVAELQQFVDCVLHDRSPSVGGMDGLMAVILGLAAKKSLQENRPVRVSEVY